MSERTTFEIPIGDWSDDGHGKCERHTATANGTIEEVREAFFKAAKEHPLVDPTSFACRYEDSLIPGTVIIEAKRLGYEFDFSEGDAPDGNYFYDIRDMAFYIAWFLNLGNPALDVRIEPEKNIPQLVFYGADEQQRHINSFGYGLFH